MVIRYLVVLGTKNLPFFLSSRLSSNGGKCLCPRSARLESGVQREGNFVCAHWVLEPFAEATRCWFRRTRLHDVSLDLCSLQAGFFGASRSPRVCWALKMANDLAVPASRRTKGPLTYRIADIPRSPLVARVLLLEKSENDFHVHTGTAAWLSLNDLCLTHRHRCRRSIVDFA